MSEVDLVLLIRSKNLNLKIIDKDQIHDEAFQDEEDDNHFVEFDDYTVTIPVSLLEGHPLNFSIDGPT